MLSVLMILGDFAPQNNCASIPNTKLAKYMAREDVKITLITKAITPDMNIDADLVPKELDMIECIHIGYTKLYSKTLGASRTKITQNGIKDKMKAETRPVQAYFVSILKNVFFRFRRSDWLYMARKQVKRTLKGRHFDCVYSTYPDLDAHYLASHIVKKGMADKWIADFRDPMYYEHYFNVREKSKNQQLQHKIELSADHITVVSEGGIEKFQFPDVPMSKITYIPNGYDPEDFVQPAIAHAGQSDTLRIFYAGTLYSGKRDFTVLFRALYELAQEGSIDLSRVQIEYAGNEWSVLRSFAETYDMADCCVNYGFVTRQRVMELLGEVDCSIVCTHNTNTDKGVVTGKVFELLLAEKPIIAVVNGDLPNSELGCIVRECDAGIVYEQASAASDYPLFKQWLADVYAEKISSGSVCSTQNSDAKLKYSYESIANSLYRIMDKISQDRNDNN